MSVSAKWGDGYWTPDEIRISGAFNGKGQALADLIEGQLGIAKEKQHWSDTDDTEH